MTATNLHQTYFTIVTRVESVAPKSTSKIIATRRKKDTIVSLELCMNAAGTFLPPMLVYARQSMKPELLNGCSPGMWADCHMCGWTQKDMQKDEPRWFKTLVQFSGPSKEWLVLYIHSS
ncbi:hypothetical protein PR048_010816 [Dryococelus australis]|uniref:Uncharacterized protein n=1 Tax=Dryococelus australis TaxID=614101 RepID=A0ABQ9I3R3_9NEOP|nr:hypothetical protein PR048_010816 [Dryococelus australis]